MTEDKLLITNHKSLKNMSTFFDKIKKFLNPTDEPEVEQSSANVDTRETKNEAQPAKQNATPVETPKNDTQYAPAEPAEPEPVATAENIEKSGVEETPKNDTQQPSSTTEAKSEQQQQTAPQSAPAGPKTDEVSAPQIRASVIKNVVQMLKPLLGKDDFKGIAFYVEQHNYALTLDKEFEKLLRIQFDDMGFRSLGSGKIEVFERPSSADAHNVYRDIIFAEIITKESNIHHAPRKARITVFRGKGSLKQTEYILDTAVDNKKVYCIGRGEISTKGGVFRDNDIVINEAEPDPAIANLNNYVSSSHANIEVRDGGFYLKAMLGGIANGNATKYIRDGKVFKLETDSMSYPLRDGDLIELGRSVLLKFEILM